MSETVRLRFTGGQTLPFIEVGELHPGDEFDIPADRLAGFIRRPDVEHAGECPQPPCRCGGEPEPEAPVPPAAGRRTRKAAAAEDGAS